MDNELLKMAIKIAKTLGDEHGEDENDYRFYEFGISIWVTGLRNSYITIKINDKCVYDSLRGIHKQGEWEQVIKEIYNNMDKIKKYMKNKEKLEKKLEEENKYIQDAYNLYINKEYIKDSVNELLEQEGFNVLEIDKPIYNDYCINHVTMYKISKQGKEIIIYERDKNILEGDEQLIKKVSSIIHKCKEEISKNEQQLLDKQAEKVLSLLKKI